MSETATGAAAPSTPASDVSDASLVNEPAPSSRPEISISDAARLLRRARATQNEQRSETIQNRGEAPASLQPQADTADRASGRGLAALDRALGVPGGAEGEQTAPEPGATPPAEGQTRDGFEIDGRRYEASELRSLVAAGQDYTRKTQQLAEQMRQLEGQQQALAQFLPHIQPEVQRLQQTLAEAPRPDPALRQQDPASYWEQFARWQDAMAEQQRFAQINMLQQQARDAAMQQAVDEGNAELAKKWPFWADPTQRAEIQQEVVRWALDKGGYTKDELRGLTNARYLETMIKAMNFDRMVAGSKTSAPASRMRTASPMGAAPPPPPAQHVAKAMEAFEARPSIRSGAALLGARRSNSGNGHSTW